MTSSSRGSSRGRISLLTAGSVTLFGAFALFVAASASADDEAAHPFLTVHRVLLSPRCMNCHPAGDAPLQGDDSRPHAMRVRRDLEALGQSCQTCHREKPAAAPKGTLHLPPNAPHWHLPPTSSPMVFEGLGPRALCEQLKDPTQNGQRSLDDLVSHVEKDALVLWGWNPGPGRTPVPVPHADFVKAFRAWRDLGGACPDDDAASAPSSVSP